ncbi:MAG: hypothetical protein CL666_17040 [Balneola sp.]|nr:hypothetical protein [Balneola sp.]|tara:strand:- start:21198 stop:22196 length:999 start_codon:yes stop_codon:yes gene_type:complete
MSEKVTYGEIIEALSRKTGFSKNKSEAFSKALIAQIKQELEETGKASITNFGSFKVKEVAARQGQNPQTGEPITIPAHKRVTFSPYKALRETVNAKYAHLESELVEEEDQPKKAEPVVAEHKAEEPKRSFTPGLPQKRKSGNSNMVIMMVAVLVLAVVAIASAWFFMNSGEEDIASRQTQPPVQNEQPVQNVTSEEETEKDEVQSTANAEMQEQSSSEVTAAKNSMAMESYTVKPNEWYWVISNKVYGNPHFWPLIFQQNFSAEHHPDSLEENTTLSVPQLQGSAGNLTKSDYKNLFEAAMMVSEAYHNAGLEGKAFEYARYSRQWEKAAKE